MNNQQGPVNAPFSPKKEKREVEQAENQNMAPRLRRKTKLRGLLPQQTSPANIPSFTDNAVHRASQSPAPTQQTGTRSLQSQQSGGDAEIATPPQRLSWNEMATQAFLDAQVSWNEIATQGFPPSPAQQPSTHSNNAVEQSSQRTPTSQLSHDPALFNKPMFPRGNDQPTSNVDAPPTNNVQPGANSPISGSPGGIQPSPTRNLNSTGILPGPTGALGSTGALMHPAGEYSGDTGMLKLNQAVKVVRIPVAGKPGEYKTGILPMLAQANTGALPPPTPAPNLSFQDKIKQNSKRLMLATLIVLALFASSIYLFTHSGSNTTASMDTDKNSTTQTSLNATATANVQATATFENSELISDPLSSNTRSWLTTANRSDLVKKGIHMFFKDSAYHIGSNTTDGNTYFASSVLRNENLPTKFSYSVDAQQIKGDESDPFNFFGLLFSYTEINGHAVTYAFRIINDKNDRRYEFCTLDDRRPEKKWSDPLWKKSTGREFHGGKAKNNVKVHVAGHNFTFWVNSIKLGSVKDTSYGPGAIGLGVNGLHGGSEVAFTNLLLTKN